MNRYGRCLRALGLAILVLLGPACGRRDTGPGGLKVLLALPRGTVEEVSSIDVSFDHPMVAVGATTTPGGRAPFRLTPRVPGRFRWIGTRTASFVPEIALPAATRFRVTVPAGTRSVDGKSLSEEFSWAFSTPTPALTGSFPERPEADGGGRRRLDTVPPEVEIRLTFNQPVSPAAVQKAARLRPERPGGSAVALRAGRPLQKPGTERPSWKPPLEHEVVLKPSKPLAKDSGWLLTIDGSLKGMGGPLPMGGAVSVPFRTCGPFRITSARPGTDGIGWIVLQATNPVDDDSLRTHLRFDPPAHVENVWSWGEEEIRLMGAFEPGRTYRLTVAPGLKDYFGNPLEALPAPLSFTTGDLPPAVEVIPPDGVLERGRDRRVAVLLTNVDRALLEIKAIGSEDVPRLEDGDSYSSRAEAVAARSRRSIWPLPGEISRTLVRRTPRNLTDTVFVATDEALGPGGAGTLALRVSSLDPGPPGNPDYRERPRPADTGLFRVTDIGLTAKTSETGHLVWATSLATGEPLAGVSLELRAWRGAVIWRGSTDARGLAEGPGVRVTEDGNVKRLFARRGDDETWLTLGRDWPLASWWFEYPDQETAGADLDGMVYGDRDLYRPGETVHLKGMMRERIPTGLRVPAGFAARLRVEDPRGKPLLDTLLTISSFGTVALDMPLPSNARPGGYEASLSAEQGGRRRSPEFPGWFRVAEYRAPDFEAEMTIGQPWFLSGQAIEARLQASYFFGAPLAGGDVRWTLGRQPADFAPPGWPGYVFNDPDRPGDYQMVIGNGTGTLGADGRLTLSPRADLEGQPASMRYELEADITDLTGRTSSVAASTIVHRGLAYPGVKLKRSLVKAGDTVPVEVVEVTPEGKPAAGATGRVSLVRREWRTARRLMVGGEIGAETARVDTTLESRSLPPGAGPHRLEFSVPAAGSYQVVVEVADRTGNRQRSVGSFYASGPGEFGWGWRPGWKIDLITDREEYAPGDTARILVRSPFRDALALVTVERENVREAWTRRLEGTSEVVEILIPRQGAAPNLFVSVALVTGSRARAGADPRLAKPEFRLGQARLAIDYSAQVLAVSVAPAWTEAAPGDSMRVSLRVTDRAGYGVAGEVSLAVVDEAVLALLGTTTPDPAAHFYAPRPLSVQTSELRRALRLAPQPGEKGEEPGGGGGEESEGMRSRFATTAAWLPGVLTDASGRAEVGFRLPDNLTRFRIMAVAADAGERFGSADTSFTVTKPLLVQPALPRFAMAGDQFRVGAVVHNRTDRPLTVDVAAEAEGIQLRSSPRAMLMVPAHDSRRADFPVTPPAAGPARIAFRARSGSVADAVEITLPVHRPAAWRTDATAGLASGPAEEKVALPADAIVDSARVDLEMAPTLLGGLASAFGYLKSYPYGCLEQVGSAEWARMLEARLSAPERSRDAAEQALARLAVYQRDAGGFGLWPFDDAAGVWPSAYALLILAEAGRAGAPVKEVASETAAYLDRMLRWQGPDSADVERAAPRWAMTLWALAEAGVPEEGGGNARGAALDLLTALRGRLSLTTRVQLALAWQRRPGGEQAQRVILEEIDNLAEQVADLAWISDRCRDPWERGWYSRERLTGLYLAASLRSGRRSPLEPKAARWLLEQRKNGRWESTQANIMSLLGLLAWRETNEGAPPDLTVRAAFGDRPAAPVRFTALDQPAARTSWPAPPPGAALPLRIDREGSGLLYYTASLHYLEPTVGRPPLETGMTLTRSWELFKSGDSTAPSGSEGAIRPGDLVLVRLTLVLPEEASFLVLADPLPGGLEPVDLEFRTTSRQAVRAMTGNQAGIARHAGLPASYREQRDREVRVFADHVPAGVYEYVYLARAVTAGRFAAPAARAELMYHPEVIALTDGPWFEVQSR